MQVGLSIVEHSVAAYGTFALFVIIYFEALGVPLPGESALIAVSALAARGDINLFHALVAAFCGAVLGDNTGYAIGHFGGRPLMLRSSHLIGSSPERLAKLEERFHAKGIWIVMGARFVVILRQLNGFIAGVVFMPWLRFFVADALGAAAWVLVWGLGPAVHGFKVFLER